MDDVGVVLQGQAIPDLVTLVAWESRKGGRHYFYCSIRHGGTVHKAYFGAGEAAHRLAQAYEADRLAREDLREMEREEMARLERLVDPILELCEVAGVLAEAHLVTNGYHRHKGEWRRAREQ